MTATTNISPTGYSEWKEEADRVTNLRQASVKNTNVWISYMVGGVLASLYYANKTRNWIPTGISTAVAVVTSVVVIHIVPIAGSTFEAQIYLRICLARLDALDDAVKEV